MISRSVDQLNKDALDFQFVKLTGNSVNAGTGDYHQLKILPDIPGGDTGFANGYKYFLLCPWVGVENKIVGKLYAGRHSIGTTHGRNWVIDITSRYSTGTNLRQTNYSIQSTIETDTFNLVKVTYDGIEYLAIKLTDVGTPVFIAGIVFSGFERGCIFKWVNESSITNEEVAPTYGYNKFSNKIKASNMLSGNYFPIIRGIKNVESFTIQPMYYSVVDNVVSVIGNFFLQATAVGAVTEFSLSLPIGSNRWWRSASGNVTTELTSMTDTVGVVFGNATDLSTVICRYKATVSSGQTTVLAFSYVLPE